MTSRDERIENYYQQSAWDLAERIVDLEDEVKKLKDELGNAQAFHDALEAAGIDNWEGYAEAWTRFDSGDF